MDSLLGVRGSSGIKRWFPLQVLYHDQSVKRFGAAVEILMNYQFSIRENQSDPRYPRAISKSLSELKLCHLFLLFWP